MRSVQFPMVFVGVDVTQTSRLYCILVRLELILEDTALYKETTLAVPPADHWHRIILAGWRETFISQERVELAGQKAVSLADDDPSYDDCFSRKANFS